MADVERTICKDGVHFGGVAYALNALVGERVQIRHMPHDLRQVEVFRDHAWLASCSPREVTGVT